jgi:hypothetical protein
LPNLSHNDDAPLMASDDIGLDVLKVCQQHVLLSSAYVHWPSHVCLGAARQAMYAKEPGGASCQGEDQEPTCD